jgi:hypothetical protein
VVARVAAASTEVAAQDTTTVEVPASPEEERRACIRSKGAKKRAVHRWTNMAHTPPPSLAVYTRYGESSSSSSSSEALRTNMDFVNGDDEEA